MPPIFGNAGIAALLLDIVRPDQPDRNAAARAGLEAAAKQQPGAFFTDSVARLITPGNFEDDRPAFQPAQRRAARERVRKRKARRAQPCYGSGVNAKRCGLG